MHKLKKKIPFVVLVGFFRLSPRLKVPLIVITKTALLGVPQREGCFS